VCAGSPARVICSLDEYLDRHRKGLRERPTFPYTEYDLRFLTPKRRAELLAATADGDAYVVGGFTATLEGGGGMQTTPFVRDHASIPHKAAAPAPCPER
jgi:hypothetical protein